jgi:hypothetical protein
MRCYIQKNVYYVELSGYVTEKCWTKFIVP